MPPEPFAITSFCDDIRYEVGGKHSLIGIYRDDMTFSGSFPLTIARLGVSVTYVEHPSLPVTDLDVLIFLPGDSPEQPSFHTHMEAPKIDSSPDATEDKQRLLNFHFILSPLILKEEGRIKVRLLSRGTRIRAGTLLVRSEKQQEALPAPA